MISLRKLFGHDDRFYDLMEASAGESKASAELLVRLLERIQKSDDVKSLDELVMSRRKDKRITREITAELCRTFVTPFEREDIQSLSHSLHHIPKIVFKAAERILICPEEVRIHPVLLEQGALLLQATELVCQVVGELRHGPRLAKIQETHEAIQMVEGKADKLVFAILKDLYTRRENPLEMIILKDYSELIEDAVDRSRDAGNVVLEIALKHA